MRLAPLCCYATDPDTRPDCTLTPVVAFGATRLCASCAARRSTMGKGQRPRPLETPALDVLTWLAAAEHDLRAARHALHAAARRARQRGHSWQVIGDQLGISRPAAQQRFGQDCNQDLLDGLEPWGVLRGRTDTTTACSASSNSTPSTTTFTNPSSPAHSLAERTPCPAYGSCCLKAGIEGEGNGVRSARLWAGLLGLVKVVVEGVEFDEAEQAVVVSVRPRKATKRRCGRCGKRCPGYDQGAGRRRWRTLDLGLIPGVPGGRRAAGALRRAWGHRRAGAVGEARCRPHLRLR